MAMCAVLSDSLLPEFDTIEDEWDYAQVVFDDFVGTVNDWRVRAGQGPLGQ